MFGRHGTPPSEMNTKGFQRDAVTGDGMFHRAKRLESCRFNAETVGCVDNFQTGLLNRSSRRQSALTIFAEMMSGLIQLCGTATWTWMDFRIREFPQVRVDDPVGPLPDQETSVSLNHKGNEMSRRGGCPFAKVRQFSDAAFAKRDAELFCRANCAPRISRRANQRAEFHKRLVEVGAIRIYGGARLCRAVTSFVAGRVSSRGKLGSTESRPTSKSDQLFRQLPELRVGFLFARIFSDAKHPREDADDIAIENWCRLVEGDAPNRAGGVTADTGQGEHVIEIIREFVGDDVRSL